MLGHAVASRLDLPVERISRVGLFVAIGVVQYAANALARTAAESLFLSNAGAKALPVYLILVGVLAAPVAGALAQYIDRMPKVVVYRASLVIAIVAVLLLRALVPLGATFVWFAVLIGIVLIEILLNLQYWVLISEFFTSLEQKRLIVTFVITRSAGSVLGAAAANLLSQWLRAADLLVIFPFLFAATILLLLRLQRSERPLESEAAEKGESLWASLGTLPALVREYPIVGLMALVGFFDVLLGGVGSYLAYATYANSFPDEQKMTAFLGTLKAVLSVVDVLVIVFITQPLVRRLGVGRSNVIFPASSAVTLIAMAVRPGVPTAVAASVTYDTIGGALNNPVENLTYNAVPPRFLGRVRSVSEGILQPSGLAVGGLVLLAAQSALTAGQITWIAVGAAVVHTALAWWRGRKYVDALSQQLSTSAVELSGGDGARVRVPEAYAEEVDRLLAGSDPETRAFGLELAARIGADRFLPTARPVLAKLHGRGREAGVAFLAALQGRRERSELHEILRGGDPGVQALVLEALLRLRGDLAASELETLFRSPDAKVRGLARAASLRTTGRTGPLLTADPELGDAGLAAVARGARAAADRSLVPALVEAMMRGAPATRATAIEGLVAVAPLGAQYASVLSLVELELESDDPRVRAAACALLGTEDRTRLAMVARGLEDSHAMVRRRAGEVLAATGDAAIPYLAQALASNRPEVAEAGLDALGRVRTQAAADAALAYLEADFARVERNSAWRLRLPAADLRWRPLEAVLDDSDRRAVHQVLRVLGAFGHARILRHARQALRGKDARLRANAVEALASIPQRRFVLPVQHLLEALAQDAKSATSGRGGLLALDELAGLDDRWVRVAALEVARALERPLGADLAADPDPLVRATVEAQRAQKETPMSRLLFLKRVALFHDLSLDDLLALDGALRRNDYLPEETIFEEGTIGEDFYLISEGEVSVRAGAEPNRREVARLSSSDFFGEMALFDDEPRSATCVAATKCTLLVLDRSRFYSLIEQLPQLGVAICRTLSQRLRRTERDLRAARAAQA
jgi:CRP-like cAMP-binding protein/HEAT repeat protein